MIVAICFMISAFVLVPLIVYFAVGTFRNLNAIDRDLDAIRESERRCHEMRMEILAIKSGRRD